VRLEAEERTRARARARTLDARAHTRSRRPVAPRPGPAAPSRRAQEHRLARPLLLVKLKRKLNLIDYIQFLTFLL